MLKDRNNLPVTAGEQPIAHASRVKADLVIVPNRGGFFFATVEIGIYFRSPFQIVADHRIDVAEIRDGYCCVISSAVAPSQKA